MLNIRRGFLAASYIKNSVFYSSASFKKRGKFQKKDKPKTRENYDYLFGRNPGADSQIEALQLTEKDLSDPNVLEDMEKQFWSVDKVLDDVEREEHIQKELLEIYQVQRKQFKGKKYPNMLLWDEKQEIKALHSQDPEKWTVMRLAFSYPASPSVIKKVLESADWKLRTQEDIENHDRRVRKNWKALENGTLDVPSEDLKKPLKTFSNRSKLAQNTSYSQVALPKKNEYNPTKDILKDGGVFGGIYKSYKLTQKNTTEDIQTKEETSIDKGLKSLHYPPSETFIIPGSVQNVQTRTKSILPLDEMKKRVLQNASNDNLSHDEQNFIQDEIKKHAAENSYDLLRDPIRGNVNSTSEMRKAHTNYQENKIQDHLPKSMKIEIDNDLHMVEEIDSSHKAQNEVLKTAHKFVDVSRLSRAQHKQDQEILASFKTAKLTRTDLDNKTLTLAVKDYLSQSSESYPLQIVIPKELWKKGALYRIKDRFYTDDGEFLYRVPGLRKD